MLFLTLPSLLLEKSPLRASRLLCFLAVARNYEVLSDRWPFVVHRYAHGCTSVTVLVCYLLRRDQNNDSVNKFLLSQKFLLTSIVQGSV